MIFGPKMGYTNTKMDVKLTYKGKVENGRIILPSARFKEEVTQAFEGRQIEVIVQRRRKRRSPEQNRYYWGVVITILAHSFKEWNPQLVLTPEDVHEWAKERFLPMITDLELFELETPEGKKEMKRTTARLTTAQFMDYIALIQEWAAEYSLYIPDPNEWEFESLERIDVDAH